MLLALHLEWQERGHTKIPKVWGDQLSNLLQEMEAFGKLKIVFKFSFGIFNLMKRIHDLD